MDTAYAYHPIYLEHNLPSHPEHAGRLERIISTLGEHGILASLRLLDPIPATVEAIRRVHTSRLIEQVRCLAETGGGHVDHDTYVSPRSFEAALMAAGGVIRAVEAVLAGEVTSAFALVRPPGHHATSTRAMGFCLFNNIAVAARAALAEGSAERVFIVDFDVHHGNGTQDAFAGDPAVFYASTHQYPLYPGTGHWDEIGPARGERTTLNIPLPAGVGDAGYAEIFTELVWPMAERFRPDLMLVSAGYDAHWSDPLARMSLSLAGYGWLQTELVDMAKHLCRGQIVFALEGGYQLDVLSHGVLSAFRAMMGLDSIADPLGPSPYPERSVGGLVERLRELHGLD